MSEERVIDRSAIVQDAGPPAVVVRTRGPGQKGERTRQLILDAAKDVFNVRGYAATRVDDITSEAGISHGTFYLYYKNKAAVLEALAIETAEQLYALTDRLDEISPGEEGFDQLCRWVEAYFDIYTANAPVAVAWMAAYPDNDRFDALGRDVLIQFAQRMARAIRHSASQANRRAAHAGISATALIAMLERFGYYWIVRGAGFERDDVVETLAGILYQSIFGRSHTE